MKNFLKKPAGKAIIALAALAVLIGGYWYMKSGSAPSFDSYAVAKGDVVSSVDEPGTVLAENNASLAFQEAGAVAHVYVKEGDFVNQGEVLADLDSSAYAAGVAQAQGALAAAQARLDSLKTGTRPEQIAVNQSAVSAAQASLNVAVTNAYTAADDAIRNQTDNLFSTPQSNSPVFLVSVSDSQMRNDLQNDRVTIGAALAQWYAAMEGPNASPASLASTAANVTQQVQQYLNTVALAVNNAAANTTMSATALAQYRTYVGTARTEVATAVGALTGAQTALVSAQSQLTLAQAGATSQDIEAQEAVVAQAKAALASAQVALDHASIVAPFSGTVNDLSAKIGQVASPGVPVLTLVNTSGLKVETYVSEADVAKIKEGDAANVTLDAFGAGTAFPAIVTTVDTVQSTVNGASAYKVTLHFASADSRLRDGMTGNVHIITEPIYQGSCRFTFYKDPTDIPEEFYTRIGKKKPAAKKKADR